MNILIEILFCILDRMSCFKKLLYYLFKNPSTINLYQGIMCRVLHMARCTNVIRLGHLALHSEVVRGIKTENYKP